MNEFELKTAQENFRKRREDNAKVKQIDNADLVAGSPMYFYCRFCGALTDTLPEGYLGRPRRVCTPCEVLEKLGAIPGPD